MAYTPEQAESLKKAHTQLQMRLNSMAEADGASDDDPNYVLLKDKMDRLGTKLERHYSDNRQTDANGRLTADAESTRPIRNEEGKGPNEFFYEPSVAEVRHRIENDADLRNRLNLNDWVQQFDPSQQVVIQGPTDPTTGSGVNFGVQPPTSRLDSLRESKDPESTYQRVATEMWNERLADAQQRGANLQRYSKVKLGEDPLAYVTGGAQKVYERGVQPAATAGYDALTLGTMKASAQGLEEVAHMADPNSTYKAPDYEAVERRNPALANAARVASYMLPTHPTNLAARAAIPAIERGGTALAKRLFPKAVEEAAELGRVIPAVRYGTAAAFGGAGAGAEGVVQDVSQARAEGQGYGDAIQEAANNLPANAFWGGLMSLPFEAAAHVMSNFRQGIQEGNPDIRALRDAGGETAFIGDNFSGVEAPRDMRRNVTVAAGDRTIGQAEDVYADEIAPKMQQHLDTKARDEYSRAEAENEAYFNHPAYQGTQSSQDAVNAVLDLAKTGWTTGKVSGLRQNVDRDRLRDIGEALEDGVIEWTPYVSKARAEKTAKKIGGTVIDGTTASYLFPGRGIEPNQSIVIVGNDLNAQTLTVLERRIDDVLKKASASGGIRDEVYDRFNQSIKKVRDRFDAWVDDDGNLVAPPGWQPPSNPPPKAKRSRAPRVKKTPVDEGFPPEPGEEPFPLTSQPAEPFPLEHERVEPMLGEATPRVPGAGAESLRPSEYQMEPETIGSGDVRVAPPSTDRGSPPFTEKFPSTKRSISPDAESEAFSTLKGNSLVLEPHDGNTEPVARQARRSDKRGNLEKLLDAELGDDQSLPAPNAKEWKASDQEGAQWYDEIVTPGQPARSAEAKRMQDLAEQQRLDDPAASTAREPTPEFDRLDEAIEYLQPRIELISKHLGPIPENDLLDMLRGSLNTLFKGKVSEEQLKELAKMFGPFAVGAAVDQMSDEEGSGAAVGAAVGGIMGGGKKGPRRLTAKLDDGTEVTGFSAMRRLQHERMKRLRDVGAGVSADSDKAVRRKVLNFNQHSGTPEDKMLMEIAKELGLEEQLWKASATNSYGNLRNKGTGGLTLSQEQNGGGFATRLLNLLRGRGDAAMRALSGDPIRPHRSPELGSAAETAMHEILNLSGGRPGARFGDDTKFIRDYLWSLISGEREEQQPQ